MKKVFIIALAAVLSVMSVNAQEHCNEAGKCCGGFTPSWFVQFQGGVQLPNTPGLSSLISPAWSLNVGRNITPLVSARLGIEGVNSKVYNAFTDEKQHFKYATGSFDAMLNITNLIAKKCNRPVNLFGFAGVGCNWSGMATTNSSQFSPNIRVGAQLDWRVARNLALNLEYRADKTNDQFNGRLEQGTHDWYTSLLLGVSLVFPEGKKVIDRTDEIDALNKQIDALKAENEALKNRKPEVKEVVKETKVVEKTAVLPNVFFQCDKSNIQTNQKGNVETIANYMKQNPDCKVTIKGYASVDGNADHNQKLSEARAKSVADALVKNYGIAADRIFTEAYGETDAIFSERNLNRVAVSVAK